MKQTKKLTRSQRQFIQKKGLDTRAYRVVEETNKYITVQHENGEIKTLQKGDND